MAKDIEPKLKLIGDYLKLNKDELFVIPEYQRGYSWNISQCDKLWQDIEGFIDADVSEPYFFGTIISDCSKEGIFSLIDGQQRTTTFLLLLKALQLRLKEVLNIFVRDPSSEALEEGLKENRNKVFRVLYKADVDERIEIIKDWNKAKGINILINHSINEKYKDELKNIVEAKDFSEAEANVYKIPRRQKDNKYTNFFRNFKFFYEKLQEYSESQLNNFAKVFLGRCQIIDIRSWQVEQAITMFNSLNSTGMPLSDADIISAQLYSNAGDEKDKFNKQWEKITILASELYSRGIINIDSVLQEYMYIVRAENKEYMKNGNPDVTTPGLRNYYTIINKKLLEDPFKLCNAFEKITLIWDKIKDYPIVKLLLKYNENAKLYLASYLYRYNLEDIDQYKVIDFAECLIKLFTVLELVDAGYSSSNFKTFLFGENIKLVDITYTFEEIKNDFEVHINKVWNKDGISSLLKDYNKNILVFLNEYLFAKENSLRFDFNESVNIEHIMPASGHNLDAIRNDAGITDKDEFDSLVNKLGNKILLEENINKSIGKEWFQTKKQKTIGEKAGYKDSKYNMAVTLVDYPSDRWTKDDIITKTDEAVERIVRFIFS